MNCGYIKLHRKSLDSGIIQNHKLWAFWTWCLLKATHKPRKQMVGMQMVKLEPGQGKRKAAREIIGVLELRLNDRHSGEDRSNYPSVGE